MKFLIFLGSVRKSTPPKPARLGERVAKACERCLLEHYSEHEIELIDPLDYDLNLCLNRTLPIRRLRYLNNLMI